MTSNYSYDAGIADLSLSFDLNSTRTDGEIIREPKDDLNEISVGYGSHAFRQHIVTLVVSVA
jgi:hypothetical protein